MIMRVNQINTSIFDNASTLSVSKHVEHLTPLLNYIQVFKFSCPASSNDDHEPILPFFFRTVERLLPPYQIIFDFSAAHQVSEAELDDLIAIGLVFIDLNGRVIVSGACEQIQHHLQNQGVSRFIPQIADLQTAISMFE
ncbi:hypothetical protein [uncultured Rubinisphaera sp.]|uniref:hypothetical protein n=1 Tax=uncultured Rubinisphaera sp. TaxID=1678686 RepID=UPI0030DD98C6